MNKLLYILLFAFILVLTSCGDDHLIDKNAPTLKQYVYATPDGVNGDIATFYDPASDIYVEQGQTIKFFAGYSIGGSVFTDETLQQYYNGLLWKIDESTYNLSSFRHTFLTPGEFEGSLETTDTFGDTLRSTFKIHVNTPNQITLESPANGYNQASPDDDQELTLQWKISGIDPWEKATCIVFMSYDQDSVWDSPLGYVDCNDSALLKGSLIQTYDPIADQEISAYDSSFTLYWGAKLFVKSESGRQYRDSTEIFHFSTKILEETSTLKIPFVFEHFRDISTLHTNVYLITSKGDTLKKFENFFTANTIVTKVEPQEGLKIIMEEEYHKEYASESLVVDIPPYTVLTADTIVLKDKTPPQIATAKDNFPYSDSIVFNIYDDGSGFNPSRLRVIMDFDTLNFNYSSPALKFKYYKDCTSKCKLTIKGEDYARNSLPNVYWTVETIPGYRLISGPYLNEGI